MPQLDMVLLASQSSILLLLIIGYILFIKYIIPMLSLFLKFKNKFAINQYKFFIKAINYRSRESNLACYNYTLLKVIARIYKFIRLQEKFKTYSLLTFSNVKTNRK